MIKAKLERVLSSCRVKKNYEDFVYLGWNWVPCAKDDPKNYLPLDEKELQRELKKNAPKGGATHYDVISLRGDPEFMTHIQCLYFKKR